MATPFAKVHGTILNSSIWLEDRDTRLLWLTMLIMANWDGVVEASVGGLAHRARLPREDVEKGLEILCGPDPDSRDGTTGERIEKVPGGWFILNVAQYRDRQTDAQVKTNARVRKHRAKRKSETEGVTGNDATPRNDLSPTDRDLDVDGRQRSEKSTRAPKPKPVRPEGVSEEVWKEWVAHRKRKRASVTPLVIKQHQKEADKAGISLEEAFIEVVSSGWMAFKAAYVENRGRSNGQPKKHIAKDTSDEGEWDDPTVTDLGRYLP
jgi:hypothetical protein